MTMKMTLAEIAALTGGELDGEGGRSVTGAAGLLEAEESDISFLGNSKYASQAQTTRAGCVLLPRSAKGAGAAAACARIYVDDPQWAFAQVLGLIDAQRRKSLLQPVVSSKAEVHAEARLSPNVAVGPFSVIERCAQVGEGTSVGAQCYIGAHARIGRDCRIYPQVTVRDHCVVGDRVTLHPGVVIGADGYGFSTDPKTGAHRKIPQIGDVIVEDDVEIGANVCVDRATTGHTRVGAGTKIDNLVQIAHNVQIGRNCLIVSQVGISGSTRIGNQVVLAGQAGIIGHLTIGDGAVITAQSGVIGDVEPKAVLFGSPARPHREAMKLQALIGKLPEIYEALKAVRSRVKLPEAGENHAKG